MSGRLFKSEAPNDPELESLLEKARQHKVTDAELQEQRISFAAGNLALDRPEESLGAIKARVRRAASGIRLRDKVSDDVGGR